MVYSASAPVVEWSITPDCKFGAFGLRWFESNPAHCDENNPSSEGFFRHCGLDSKPERWREAGLRKSQQTFIEGESNLKLFFNS